MPESIRTYANRCRGCLEKFFDNEKLSPLTSFIVSQFQSFTNLTLQESDLLSHHLCEFCHQELLRFSVFKKDLIEKQQKLNELLKCYDEKVHQRTHRDQGSKGKIGDESELESSSGEDEAFSDVSEIDYDEEEEEEIVPQPEVDEPEESTFSESDDARDQDFSIKSFSITINSFKSRTKKPEPVSAKPLGVGEFICDYCTVAFKAKQGLTRHVQSHIANSVPWKCDVEKCKFAASSRVKINLHRFEAHNIPVSAGRSSEQLKKPKVEVKVEEQEVQDFICFCGLKFKSMYSLRAHKNRLHRSLNKCIYGCKNLQYVKSGQFLRHVQLKHPEHYAECLKRATATVPPLKSNGSVKFKIFQCERCDFKTMKQADLKAHVDMRHQKKFKCCNCGNRYSKAYPLARHKLTCRKKDTRVVNSPIGKPKVTKMLQMREETPGAESRHACETPGCKMAFSKRFNLMRHQKAKGHLSPEELKKLKYKCVCGERFFSASGHAYHRDKMKCLKKNPIYED